MRQEVAKLLVTRIDESTKWLEKYLRKHGKTKSTVIKTLAIERNYSESMIKRAAKALNVTFTFEGQRFSYWELPNG